MHGGRVEGKGSSTHLDDVKLPQAITSQRSPIINKLRERRPLVGSVQTQHLPLLRDASNRHELVLELRDGQVRVETALAVRVGRGDEEGREGHDVWVGVGSKSKIHVVP